jgi:hypothetical protein
MVTYYITLFPSMFVDALEELSMGCRVNVKSVNRQEENELRYV